MGQREWDCIVAGRLAMDDEMADPFMRPVFINSERSVQFAIKPLSDLPDAIVGVPHFSCWGTKLSDFYDDPFADEHERIRNLNAMLDGKIILFKPTQKTSYARNERFHSAEPIAVLDAPTEMLKAARLIPIPYLSDMDPQDFEAKVLNRRPIGSHYNRIYPNDMPVPDPALAWVKDRLYGHFTTMRSVNGIWTITGDDIRVLPVDMADLVPLVMPFKHVMYIEEGMYLQLVAPKVEDEGALLIHPDAEPTISVSPAPEAEVAAASALADAKHAATNGHVSVVIPMARPAPAALDGALAASPTKTPVAGTSIPSSDPPSEMAFLERIKQLAQAKQLYYNEDDLVNFHAAMKTGSLVLLSGMSGTGKSRLVQLYAEALGLDDEQFEMVSVRPTWTDDSDLLGFLDLTFNVYRPADSGVIDLLVRAHLHPDKLFLVCFDEMNLARVEHYFSQFISVLELEANRRCIRLYSESLQDRIHNAGQYPAKLPIGTNIMFVGTVNVDESTYAFSDKVLDRAHVIRLRVLPFSSLWVDQDQLGDALPVTQVTYAVYDAWRSLPTDMKLTRGELEFLEHLHVELQRVDLQRGVGHRTVRQIDRYLCNIPVDPDGSPAIERAVAFDSQIVQKILTKLRGPREQLEPLVGQLDRGGDVEGSSLIRLMDEYEDVSSFTCSRAEIIQKAKELKSYGYAS